MENLKRHNRDLISYTIDENIRNVFFDLLKNVKSDYNLFLILRRPNYKIEIPQKVDIAYKDSSSFFEVVLKMKGDTINKIDSLLWAWEAYEHFGVLLTENDAISNCEKAIQSSAEKVAFQNKGFYVYRGIENNVLWIRKSSFKKFESLIG